MKNLYDSSYYAYMNFPKTAELSLDFCQSFVKVS